MVYNGTVATEADIALFAGENVDATGYTEINRNLAIAQAESYLCCLMRYNVVDNFSALNADVKAILTEWAGRYCAICFIIFNTAGYTDRIEAEDMINIHLYRMKQIEFLLRDQKVVDYIKGA